MKRSDESSSRTDESRARRTRRNDRRHSIGRSRSDWHDARCARRESFAAALYVLLFPSRAIVFASMAMYGAGLWKRMRIPSNVGYSNELP
jgi:hypothetical protein